MPAWFFVSLQGYRIAWLPRDLIAGLMLAAIAIPGQLATARLAGMPPETGLYAFAAGSLAFAAFGANRFMSVAADSTIAPIFAGGLASLTAPGTERYFELAPLLALMVGAILLAIGLFRAGWLATLLSTPVTTGFLAGISIHIIIGELPTLLGIPPPGGHILSRLIHILGHLGDTNPYALALGAGVLIVTLGAASISSKIPGAFFGLLGAGVAVALFNLQSRGVSVLGPLSVALPHLALPPMPDSNEIGHLVPLALVVAMVCIMQTSAVASTFPSEKGRPDDVSRDFAGVGAGSIMTGLIGSFAVDASPPSTAIVVESGGRSQITSITAVALMIALVVLAAKLTAFLPHAALSGILVYIALKIFRLGEMIRIYRQGGWEILVVAASAALVVALPIETGMLLAIALSFVSSLYAVARPYCAELSRVPGSTVWWPPGRGEQSEHEPGVVVFAAGAPLTFTNAQYISDQITAALARSPAPPRLLVIEASGMIAIDYTGSQILQQTIARLKSDSIDVAIARLADERATVEAEQTGLLAILEPGCIFKSVEDAVRQLGPSAKGGAP
ncbi:SulP family inorganic anion transporter [Bradyrhizobium sp. Ec3.3]|uniref:SulP family inorganic anion transporter n=1 Tax=Bradyrhizobium sp. Ec3.3 TaxID=189753 RepID=UPI00040ADBE7|nr:SulP family inorganic anion transporter [Bradyrhizobium sp. Ec3.3]